MSTFNGVRTSYELGRYTEGEHDAILGSVKTDLGTQERAIVWAHGSGQLTADVLLQNRMLLHTLAKRATVYVADFGGQQWGSELHYTLIGEVVDILKEDHDVVGGLFVSMGALGGLNYIKRNPGELACAALLIPALDLNSIRANPYLTSRWPEIDAIYGGDYTDHNPVDFASDIDPELPLKIWFSANDPLAYPSTIEAFVAARPETKVKDMRQVSHTVPDSFNIDIRRWLDRNLV